MHLVIATQTALAARSAFDAPIDPIVYCPTELLTPEMEAELVAASQAAAPSTDQHKNRAQRRAAARGKGRSDAQRRNPRNPRSRR